MTKHEALKLEMERSFSSFVRAFFEVLEPETYYKHNWHIDVLCDHLEAVYNSDIKNLNINIPPRTIKSVLVNVLFPCWTWAKDPTYKIISCSHSADLSNGFNIKRRSVILSRAYQSFWPIYLKDDGNRQKFFENTKNGFMKSVSVGGSLTGDGGDIIIMDDAINAEDGNSETKRKFANDWFSSTFYNRLKNKKTGRRINVMQRLHEEDLTGHIKKKYDFTHLVIPMQKEEGQQTNILGWVDPREVDDFLHPDLYSQSEKDDEYNGLGSYGWAGQMQQRPSPADGGIIKRQGIILKDFSGIDFKYKILSVDATFKDSKNSDYVAISCLSKIGPDYFILDVIRGKWDFSKTIDMIKSFNEKHSPKKIVIEDKANGPAIISVLKKHITGIKAYNPKDSKIARVHAVSPMFECGNVFINKDMVILEDVIGEFLSFPNGAHDDMVDSITQGLQELKGAKGFVFAY